MASSTRSKLLDSDIFPVVNYIRPIFHSPRLKVLLILQAFVLFLCCCQVRDTLSPPNHQVFISFRGKDTRNGFVSHLTDALERHNIRFFIDTHELKGRDLKHLFQRIVEVPIVLVILSVRFGESTWCLDELRISMEQAARGELIVIPIFYKVKPKDVRKNKGSFSYRFWEQKDSFGYWFWKGTKKSSREQKESWQDALNKVSKKHGIIFDENRCEAEFIKSVVEELAKVLSHKK